MAYYFLACTGIYPSLENEKYMGAKIRNPYNQVLHRMQDTNGNKLTVINQTS